MTRLPCGLGGAPIGSNGLSYALTRKYVPGKIRQPVPTGLKTCLGIKPSACLATHAVHHRLTIGRPVLVNSSFHADTLHRLAEVLGKAVESLEAGYGCTYSQPGNAGAKGAHPGDKLADGRASCRPAIAQFRAQANNGGRHLPYLACIEAEGVADRGEGGCAHLLKVLNTLPHFFAASLEVFGIGREDSLQIHFRHPNLFINSRAFWSLSSSLRALSCSTMASSSLSSSHGMLQKSRSFLILSFLSNWILKSLMAIPRASSPTCLLSVFFSSV